MELAIGSAIARLRKARGVTQAQLAEAVGVSVAAVSKWETGASYPDITLLPALARYFDVSCDQLLAFEAALAPEQALKISRRCAEAFETRGWDAGWAMCQGALHDHPSDTYLALRVASLLQQYLPLIGEEEAAQQALGSAISLLQRASTDARIEVQQAAYVGLCGLHMARAQYDEALAALAHLPENAIDTRGMRACIYSAQHRRQEARVLHEQVVYNHLTSLTTSLGALQGELLRAGELDLALHCNTCALETLRRYALGGALLLNPLLARAELYLRSGDADAALEALEAFARAAEEIEAHVRPAAAPLFAHVEICHVVSAKYLQKNAGQLVRMDEQLAPLHSHPRYQAVLARLEALAG